VSAPPTVQRARLTELAPATLYRILMLRSAVFVVEQRCAYLDLDGRDLDMDAWQLWIAQGDEVVAAGRVLREAHGSRVGRLVTAPAHRGAGHAARLLRAALEVAQPPVALSAQAHLADWYRAFGFEVVGAPFDEDGIPHVPMRRASGARA
jgi:predicted GNAT family N-acyltransferase